MLTALVSDSIEIGTEVYSHIDCHIPITFCIPLDPRCILKQPNLGLTQECFILELSFSKMCSPRQITHDLPPVWDLYFTWHRHQLERTDSFSMSPPKDTSKVG